MKIHEIKLPNLPFKVKRQKDIEGYEVLKVDKEPFDILAWTKNQNTDFGLNYLIRPTGKVEQHLPKEYQPSYPGLEKPKTHISILVIGDNGNTGEALESLLTDLGYWEKEVEEIDEPAKAHPVRSTDTNTKKGNKGKRG